MTGRRRALPSALVLGRPRASHWIWVACVEGREPAESLPTKDREDLVYHLVHDCGWTDVRIATHTRMSTATTVRIRERIGLESNHSTTITAAA
jgi:hypothetical protein